MILICYFSTHHQFSKISQLSEEEVNNAIKEVEKLFVKASCTPVCQDHQEAVMTCYQDHPRQALRCSRQVEDFARCVDLSRLVSRVRLFERRGKWRGGEGRVLL